MRLLGEQGRWLLWDGYMLSCGVASLLKYRESHDTEIVEITGYIWLHELRQLAFSSIS